MRRKKKESGKMPFERKSLIAAGVVLVGGAIIYTGTNLLKKKEKYEEADETVVHANLLPSRSVVKRNDKFPLKKGSLGNRVRLLQQAVQSVLGKAAFPDSEIDGDFGPRTESAVVKAGFPVVIDQDAFNAIVNIPVSSVQPSFNARVLSASLYNSAIARNVDGVLAVLRQLRSVADYSAVNEYFKSAQIFSVSRSIVTYLLDVAFPTDSNGKDQIRNEFKRIGLKQNIETGNWSLSGIRIHKDIITIVPTFVQSKGNQKILIRGRIILGEEVAIKNGMTYFKSLDGELFSVPTRDVKYA